MELLFGQRDTNKLTQLPTYLTWYQCGDRKAHRVSRNLSCWQKGTHYSAEALSVWLSFLVAASLASISWQDISGAREYHFPTIMGGLNKYIPTSSQNAHGKPQLESNTKNSVRVLKKRHHMVIEQSQIQPDPRQHQ